MNAWHIVAAVVGSVGASLLLWNSLNLLRGAVWALVLHWREWLIPLLGATLGMMLMLCAAAIARQ